MAVNHYENFPVASILVPRRLRGAVVDIYRFARSADDIADEGDATAQARLEALQDYRHALNNIETNATSALAPALAPIFLPLKDTIGAHRLPMQPFYDLLSAFAQDIQVKRYDNDQALFDYCSRSANPVGRL